MYQHRMECSGRSEDPYRLQTGKRVNTISHTVKTQQGTTRQRDKCHIERSQTYLSTWLVGRGYKHWEKPPLRRGWMCLAHKGYNLKTQDCSSNFLEDIWCTLLSLLCCKYPLGIGCSPSGR